MSYIFISNNLLVAGHVFTLHVSVWDDAPSQVFPVSDGGGDVHVRVLVLVPSPHERLHDAHCPQTAQFPSTGELACSSLDKILFMKRKI